MRQRLGTGATVAEVRGLVGASTLGPDELDEGGDLGVAIGVGGEAVDRDHGRQAVDVLDVARVLAQVLHAGEGVDVLGLQVGQGDPAVVLPGHGWSPPRLFDFNRNCSIALRAFVMFVLTIFYFVQI